MPLLFVRQYPVISNIAKVIHDTACRNFKRPVASGMRTLRGRMIMPFCAGQLAN